MICIENIDDIMKIPGVDPEFFIQSIPILISKENKVCGDVTVIFCSDNYLLEMNQKYLKHDYFTDVITFDYTDNQIVSGDLFVSVDRVLDNANSLRVEAKDELVRVVYHGVLHLVGFKDKTEEEKALMTANRMSIYIILFHVKQKVN